MVLPYHLTGDNSTPNRILLVNGTHICLLPPPKSKKSLPCRIASIPIQDVPRIFSIPEHAAIIEKTLGSESVLESSFHLSLESVFVVEHPRTGTNRGDVILQCQDELEVQHYHHDEDDDSAGMTVCLTAMDTGVTVLEARHVGCYILADFIGNGWDQMLLVPDIDISGEKKEEEMLLRILRACVLADGRNVHSTEAGDTNGDVGRVTTRISLSKILPRKKSRGKRKRGGRAATPKKVNRTDKEEEEERHDRETDGIQQQPPDYLQNIRKHLQAQMGVIARDKYHAEKFNAVRRKSIRQSRQALQELNSSSKPSESHYLELTKVGYGLQRDGNGCFTLNVHVHLICHDEIAKPGTEHDLPPEKDPNLDLTRLFLSFSSSSCQRIETKSGIIPHLAANTPVSVSSSVHLQGVSFDSHDVVILHINAHYCRVESGGTEPRDAHVLGVIRLTMEDLIVQTRERYHICDFSESGTEPLFCYEHRHGRVLQFSQDDFIPVKRFWASIGKFTNHDSIEFDDGLKRVLVWGNTPDERVGLVQFFLKYLPESTTLLSQAHHSEETNTELQSFFKQLLKEVDFLLTSKSDNYVNTDIYMTQMDQCTTDEIASRILRTRLIASDDIESPN